MKLLLDTNIFYEVLLTQERASEAIALLSRADRHDFYVTGFSIHSIGVFFFRRKRFDDFRNFLRQMVYGTGLTILEVPDNYETVLHAAERYNLDFDDAYIYAVAEAHDLTLVSFDSDFIRTERGRKLPSEILTEMQTIEEGGNEHVTSF